MELPEPTYCRNRNLEMFIGVLLLFILFSWVWKHIKSEIFWTGVLFVFGFSFATGTLFGTPNTGVKLTRKTN